MIKRDQAIAAVNNNDLKTLDRLALEGLDLKNVHDWKHWSLAHFAAYNNNVSMLSYFQELGHDLDFSYYGDDTPLSIAATIDAADAALYLIKAGCNMNEKRTLNGYTPLFRAAWSNSLKVMQILKENGCDLSLEANDSYRKETPAFIAARWGKIDALRLLHSYGCDITSCNADGNTPNFIASHFGHNACAEFIAQVTSNTYLTESMSEILCTCNLEKEQKR